MKPFKFLTSRSNFGIPNFHDITDLIFDVCSNGQDLCNISNIIFATNWGKFLIIAARDPQVGLLYHLRNDETMTVSFVDDIQETEEMFVYVLFIPDNGQQFYIRIHGVYNTHSQEYVEKFNNITIDFTEKTFKDHLSSTYITNCVYELFIR